MKDLKISKELIKNVLIEETKNLSDDFTFNIKDSYILFADEGECLFEVNICEFAFKCKEWAFKKGFIIDIGVHPVIKRDRTDRDYFYTIQLQNGELLEVSNSDDIFKSEATAVFKACEWILESKDSK